MWTETSHQLNKVFSPTAVLDVFVTLLTIKQVQTCDTEPLDVPVSLSVTESLFQTFNVQSARIAHFVISLWYFLWFLSYLCYFIFVNLFYFLNTKFLCLYTVNMYFRHVCVILASARSPLWVRNLMFHLSESYFLSNFYSTFLIF